MDIDTILSDEERDLQATSSEEEAEDEIEATKPVKNAPSKGKKGKKVASKVVVEMPVADESKSLFAEFSSANNDAPSAQDIENSHSWDFKKAIASINKEKKGETKQTTLDDKIRRAVEARRTKKHENGQSDSASDIADADDDSDSSVESEDEADEVVGKPMTKGSTRLLKAAPTQSTKEREEERKRIEQARATSFAELQLSRPLLRAVQMLNYESPTPIQADAIPLILKGKDILASAVTGSGKTAAYLLPVLERLLLRDRRSGPITRVLIVVPTRELAQQVSSMMEKLAQFCNDVTQAVVVGGLSMTAQALDIRARPDAIIATPGRLIDHLRNTVSFDIADLEILILDEADRLLELGFMEELREIVKYAPSERQTMLFSATMSSDVTRLAELSLKDPARIATDPLYDVARRLVQEFVRVRTVTASSLGAKELVEEHIRRREALLLALCTNTAQKRVIIFFQHKHQAHRTCITFGLLGLKCAELHGNLTQTKRLEALQRFRDGDVDFLFCTDLAARGIDIAGVQGVINFELPKDLTTYVHRVGRTARAGRGGRAISLVGDERRSTMKELLKSSSSSQFQSRTIATSTATKCYERIMEVQKEVNIVIDEEKLEREMRLAEMEATKAENIVTHQDEVMSRPKKSWFLSEAEKIELKTKAKESFDGVDATLSKAPVGDDDEDDGDHNKKSDSKEEQRERLGNRSKRRREALKEREVREANKAVKELKRSGDELSESVKKKLKETIVPSELRQRVIAKNAKKSSKLGMGARDEDGDLVIDLEKIDRRRAKAISSPGKAKNFVEKRRTDDDVPSFKNKSLAAKLRKGGKKGVHSFKSKGKFKRR